MKLLASLIATVVVVTFAGISSASPRQPRIIMLGNGGKCSLSSRKTFRMKLTGWKPNATVQLKLYYGDGQNYPYALRNDGKVKVDSRGNHLGYRWPCWPNKTYNVADKKTYYIVFAFQLGSTPLVNATATFKVVK